MEQSYSTCKYCAHFVPAKGERLSHCTGPGTYDAEPDHRWSKKQKLEWFDYECFNKAEENDPICTKYSSPYWLNE